MNNITPIQITDALTGHRHGLAPIVLARAMNVDVHALKEKLPQLKRDGVIEELPKSGRIVLIQAQSNPKLPPMADIEARLAELLRNNAPSPIPAPTLAHAIGLDFEDKKIRKRVQDCLCRLKRMTREIDSDGQGNWRYVGALEAGDSAAPNPEPGALADPIMALPLAEFERRIIDALAAAQPHDVGIARLCQVLGIEYIAGDAAPAAGPLKRLRNSLSTLRSRGQVDTNANGRWRWLRDTPIEPPPPPASVTEIERWESWRPALIAAYEFCRERELSDSDLPVVLRLGYAAIRVARREGAQFPHDSAEMAENDAIN